MRETFDNQLAEIRQELIALYTDVDLELHEAVSALVDKNSDLAQEAKLATREIDQRCSDLEDKAYNLVMIQQPVASDLRLLKFVVACSFNLARMSNHARNIAKTARRIAKKEVPEQLLDLVASQAHLVYRVLGSAIEAIVERDLELAASLPELDEPVDNLYKQFFKTFSKFDPKTIDMDAATKVIMSTRMLERISDNAVETGERLVFLLTGHRRSLQDLADLDSGNIEKMYAISGNALNYNCDEDVRLVESIPEIELNSDKE